MPRHIRKGDSVIVTKGASKGTIGEVLRVLDEGARVVVKGANIRTMHIKPTQKIPQGSILKEEGPINASNVNPVVDGKPSRVRFVSKPDGSKARVAARGGKELHQLHGARNTGPKGAVKDGAKAAAPVAAKAKTAAAPKTTKAAAAKK